MKMQKFGASPQRLYYCTRVSVRRKKNSFRNHHRAVCTRVYVCAFPMRSGFDVVLARGTIKGMKREQLAPPTRDRCSRSRSPECVFFCACTLTRGLSRSQPVFVIIMLEKCMNICFINASSYFISFYMIKKNGKWKTELFPKDSRYIYI